MNTLKDKTHLHLKRKIWHISTGVMALAITFFMQWNGTEAGIVAGLIGLFGLLLELWRFKNPLINKYFLKIVAEVAREEEKQKFSGLTFYCFGVSICFLIFSWHVAILAILYLIFGDPLAATFGKLYGKTKILPHKSLMGSFTFFMTCLLINTIYSYFFIQEIPFTYISFIFLAAIMGAVSELVDIIDDNLSIPILSALGIQILVTLYS